MVTWIKMALRNLVSNARRSAVTALAVALGFAAVNLFGGFAEYMYKGNREVAIFVTSQGHLTVFKKGFLEQGRLNPRKYLLSRQEIKTIEEICKANPNISLVTPQLQISGLLTNGDVSTIFVAQGIVPSSVDVFLSRITMADKEKIEERLEGKKLEDDKIYGVGVSHGLAKMLNLSLGSEAVAFTTTLDGQMNALDVEVFQLFNTSSSVMNDKFMRVPLAFAQKLYDTDGADRVAILLTETGLTDRVRGELQAAFTKAGLNAEIKTWKEMSDWYRRVKEMFDTIFIFLFVIVFIIVVMSVINTMSMAVLERTREIGTLRALGLKRKGVLLLFATESSLLGILGAGWGLFLTAFGWWIVHAFKPTWVPPGMTNHVNIRIELVPQSIFYSFLFLLVMCLMASLIPARRAAQQNIVDALGHV